MFISSLLRNNRTVLSVWALALILSIAAFAHRLTGDTPWIDNSVGIWFKADDPELMTYEEHNSAFGEQEWTLILLKTHSIFSAQFLQDLATITSQIESLKHVVKVTSIANVRDNDLTQEGDLNYVRLYAAGNDHMASEAEIKLLRQRLYANPIFQKNLLRKEDERYTVVLVQNDNLIHDPSPYRIELVDNIKKIITQYKSIEEFSIAGTTVVNAELNRAAKHDVIVFYLLISIFLVLFALLALRNWRDLVVLLSVVIGSVLPTMALIAYFKIPYNMMTVMLPTIMVALGVAGVIHVINTFHDQHRKHDSETALQKTLSIIIRPGFFAMLTTAAGFGSLTLSSVIPVFQLGLFAAIGIMLAWLISITVAPVLLHLLWHKQHKAPTAEDRWHWLQRTSLPWHPTVRGLVFITLVTPLCGLAMLETDTNYSEFFADHTDISQAYEKIKQAGFAQNPINIALTYPEGSKYSTRPYFSAVLKFEHAVSQLPEVIKLLSANSLLKEIDKAFNGAEDSQRLHQYDTQQVSQLLFLAELSGNDDIPDLLVRDHSKSQLLALTPYMSSKQLDHFRKNIQDLAKQHLPADIRVNITGTTALWANMDQHVSATQIQSLAGMIIFLTLLLLFVFRSVKIALIGIIVNGLPLAIVLGIMGFFDFNINIATALIGGITLGVVIDDSLHLLMRIQENYHGDWEKAISKAVTEVGRSIVFTTTIIVGGFASMMTSNFLPSAEFGTFVTLAVILALILDLWLLPQLLRLLLIKPLAASGEHGQR